MGYVLAIGTYKGVWIARSEDRTAWELSGPLLKGWEVNTFGRAPDGTWLATTGSSWYGAAVHRSDDLATWSQVVDGPSFAGAPDDRKLERIWTIAGAGGVLFAGVAEAGLFRSDTGGTSWSPVSGFNEHRTRSGWEPGFGGLAAHRILIDPTDHQRMWVGASAVGVFRTEDGGETWELFNDGVEPAAPSDNYPEIGFCVHCLVAHPDDPDLIWRQDHMGVFRTTNGGDSWERIQNGLPSRFGFPIERDPVTGRLFLVPLEADEFRSPVGGRFAVYASDDNGDAWHELEGSARPGWDLVLRDAMSVDGDGGVYIGSSAGAVSWSTDSGDTWSTLPTSFPRVLSLHAFPV
ncbi:exo-alpha-sialidase [soil metagenome]